MQYTLVVTLPSINRTNITVTNVQFRHQSLLFCLSEDKQCNCLSLETVYAVYFQGTHPTLTHIYLHDILSLRTPSDSSDSEMSIDGILSRRLQPNFL